MFDSNTPNPSDNDFFFQKVNVLKKGRPVQILENIKTVLSFIPLIHHAFYKSPVPDDNETVRDSQLLFD